jgi:hypothetical protein
MLGFDEAVAYIHDYMINNPPFDVRQAQGSCDEEEADEIGTYGFLTGSMYGRHPLFSRMSPVPPQLSI